MTKEGKGEDGGEKGAGREMKGRGRDGEMHASLSRRLQDCRNKNFKAERGWR